MNLCSEGSISVAALGADQKVGVRVQKHGPFVFKREARSGPRGRHHRSISLNTTPQALVVIFVLA